MQLLLTCSHDAIWFVSKGTCFICFFALYQLYPDNQECDISADNLIHTYLGVSTYTECQLLCEEQYPCVAFTHFDKYGQTFSEGCLLFSSCKEQRACQNCTTGSSQTECRCSIAYAGDATPDNFVDLIGSVSDEHVCKKMCIADNQCDQCTPTTQMRIPFNQEPAYS